VLVDIDVVKLVIQDVLAIQLVFVLTEVETLVVIVVVQLVAVL
jgi:hypothetical protein